MSLLRRGDNVAALNNTTKSRGKNPPKQLKFPRCHLTESCGCSTALSCASTCSADTEGLWCTGYPTPGVPQVQSVSLFSSLYVISFHCVFEHFSHPQRWEAEIQKPFDNCQFYLEIKSWNPLVHQNPTEADPLWKWFLMIPWLLSPKWLCCRTSKKIMIGIGENRFLFPT